MATQDSTNPEQTGKTWTQRLFDEIKEREERAHALVLAIQAQLPHDLNPAHLGGTSTTGHLLNVLDDLLCDQTLLIMFEDSLTSKCGQAEVQA